LNTTDVTSKFVEVKGSKIHYLDVGEGDLIVFLHGVPTSSYVWRHLISQLSKHARCIAPDLIGLGDSDKPDIEYKITDHIDYITDFIDVLGLKNITFVLHAWGSLIGFSYAMKHPENVKGVAFFESYPRAITNWEMKDMEPLQ